MSSLLRATCRAKLSSPYFASWILTQRRSYAKESPDSSQLEDPNIETFSSKARTPTSPLWLSDQVTVPRRSFATEQLPRPPPSSSEPAVTTFERTSKASPFYGRPPPRTALPLQKKRWPLIAAFIVAGVAGWAAFLLVVANQEKLSSSVVRQIMRTVKDNEELKEVLGEALRPQPEWWLNGDPWIEGAINMLQGNVDVSFRLKGHKGSGTLYFTSVRKSKGEPFTILRFRVRADDGTVVNIPANYTS